MGRPLRSFLLISIILGNSISQVSSVEPPNGFAELGSKVTSEEYSSAEIAATTTIFDFVLNLQNSGRLGLWLACNTLVPKTEGTSTTVVKKSIIKTTSSPYVKGLFNLMHFLERIYTYLNFAIVPLLTMTYQTLMDGYMLDSNEALGMLNLGGGDLQLEAQLQTISSLKRIEDVLIKLRDLAYQMSIISSMVLYLTLLNILVNFVNTGILLNLVHHAKNSVLPQNLSYLSAFTVVFPTRCQAMLTANANTATKRTMEKKNTEVTGKDLNTAYNASHAVGFNYGFYISLGVLIVMALIPAIVLGAGNTQKFINQEQMKKIVIIAGIIMRALVLIMAPIMSRLLLYGGSGVQAVRFLLSFENTWITSFGLRLMENLMWSRLEDMRKYQLKEIRKRIKFLEDQRLPPAPPAP